MAFGPIIEIGFGRTFDEKIKFNCFVSSIEHNDVSTHRKTISCWSLQVQPKIGKINENCLYLFIVRKK